MKKWCVVGLSLLLMVVLSACGQGETEKAEAGSKTNTTDVKKESPYPEADQVAREAFESIVDGDFKSIYEKYSSKDYQEYLISEKSQDTNFSGSDRQMIHEEDEILYPGDYKKLIQSGDYFLGVYDQYKTEEVLNYILIGSTEHGAPGVGGTHRAEIYSDNTDLYVYKLELIKEDAKWKLNSYHSWPHFDEFDVKDRDARVREMVRADSKKITVLHRGKSFASDSN
ncbi:hypothetical protein [Listeria fleischmannii]|uniref:DUF4829 domain-containing protein n=1 Tax=Listeria fleischmannii TaxID=1069827 RepID=A0A841YI04_9LIST|nr:hypothetical protein [Listeria fleischmannii]MBC1399906.1 hypothetical protein [Listeria fleischmannii]